MERSRQPADRAFEHRGALRVESLMQVGRSQNRIAQEFRLIPVLRQCLGQARAATRGGARLGLHGHEGGTRLGQRQPGAPELVGAILQGRKAGGKGLERLALAVQQRGDRAARGGEVGRMQSAMQLSLIHISEPTRPY